jgi:hypothetical protein
MEQKDIQLTIDVPVTLGIAVVATVTRDDGPAHKYRPMELMRYSLDLDPTEIGERIIELLRHSNEPEVRAEIEQRISEAQWDDDVDAKEPE